VSNLRHTFKKTQAVYILQEAPSISVLNKMRLYRKSRDTTRSYLSWTLFLISIGQYLLPQLPEQRKEAPERALQPRELDISRSLRMFEMRSEMKKKAPIIL
jgi:hypothetical protein